MSTLVHHNSYVCTISRGLFVYAVAILSLVLVWKSMLFNCILSRGPSYDAYYNYYVLVLVYNVIWF